MRGQLAYALLKAIILSVIVAYVYIPSFDIMENHIVPLMTSYGVNTDQITITRAVFTGWPAIIYVALIIYVWSYAQKKEFETRVEPF